MDKETEAKDLNVLLKVMQLVGLKLKHRLHALSLHHA